MVTPPVSVDLPDEVAIFPSAAARKVAVAVKSNIARAAGELRLEAPAGWKVEPKSRPFSITVLGEQQEMSFEVTPPAGETVASLRAIATIGGREVSQGMQTISYPHIPIQVLFPPASLKLVRSNIQVSVHKVGYIMGAGDEMPDALRQLGLDVTLLSKSDVESGDLSRFDAIVAGRAVLRSAERSAIQSSAIDGVCQERGDLHRSVPDHCRSRSEHRTGRTRRYHACRYRACRSRCRSGRSRTGSGRTRSKYSCCHRAVPYLCTRRKPLPHYG